MEEFINSVESNRKFYKSKLNIFLIVAASILGAGLICLLIGIIFSNFDFVLIFFIALIVAAITYGVGYSSYNKKYLNTFKKDLETKAIEANYGKDYFYDPNKGIDFDSIYESRCVNKPDEYFSKKYFSSSRDGLFFVSSNYELNFIHYTTDSDGNTRKTVNHYNGRFVKFDFPRNLNTFLSIIEKHSKDEMIKDPRIGDKIEFEFMEFNDKFTVKCNDQLKANYIITPQVQCNLVDFDKAFKSDLIVCFIDKSAYVFMHEYIEKMPLGIYKEFNKKVFDSYAYEFIIPLLLIDALDLNNDKFINANLK